MAQLITVRINKSDHQPLGIRLQGGKDFGTPLVVQKVNGGSPAERAGLQAGDALIRVNTTDVYTLRHQDAQDAIRAAGSALELTVQRGGGTWRPTVTPTGSLPRPGSRPLGAAPTPVTNTSLKATPQPNRAFGSGHNSVAKPFGYMNGNDPVKSIVNKQYNTPVNIYSDKTIAETLSAQTEVLAGGVLGVNFKKNEKTYDAEKSAVFKVLQEEQNDPEPEPSHFYSRASVARVGTPRPCSLHRSRSRTPRVTVTPHSTQQLTSQPAPRPVTAPPVRSSTGTQTPVQELLTAQPVHRASIPVGCHEVLPDGRIALGAPASPQPQNTPLSVLNDTPYCSDCNRYIIGVFVRIKDKNLHVECFKCSTCGTSLKNQGYYNINGKLYCDIHAKLVARQNPPAANLEPVTVPPGGRIPTNTYSTPLPPLATNNYTNGSSSLFSPSSNLSGPKPFGSSVGSAYSPSLSPRSAPMSPARPVAAPVSAPLHTPAPQPTLAPAAPPQAPFAPTQNVKTIVWPPPNPPEGEPKKESCIVSVNTTYQEDNSHSQSVANNATIAEVDSQLANIKEQTINKIHGDLQQRQQLSNQSYSTAAIISSTSATKSESAFQNTQCQIVQESSSHAVKSFSQQSAKSERFAYQYGTDNSSQSFENSEININTDNLKPNSLQINNMKLQYDQENEPRNLNKQDTSIKNSDNENMNLYETKQLQKHPEHSQTKVKDTNFEVNNSIEEIAHEVIVPERQVEYKIYSTNPQSTNRLDSNFRSLDSKMIEASRITPERPYSPLSTPAQPNNLLLVQTFPEDTQTKPAKQLSNIRETINVEQCASDPQKHSAEPSPIFLQQPKYGITPISLDKTYEPPANTEPPIPMLPETKPYTPPDFKITIEPKQPRETTRTPLTKALTTAPDLPFTPTCVNQRSIERGSLRDALTIAPDRPYSPLSLNTTNFLNHYISTSSRQITSSPALIKPVATQTSTDQITSEFCNIQNSHNISVLSSDMSAFKPVSKQLQQEEFNKSANLAAINSEMSNFESYMKSKEETMLSESMKGQNSSYKTSSLNSQGFSSVKSAQNYFEQLDKKESLPSISNRSKYGLHKPDSIPSYQTHFEQVPSQRGISPDMYRNPTVFHRAITPMSDSQKKTKDKTEELKCSNIPKDTTLIKPQLETTQTTYHQLYQVPKNIPISMTFQPVTEDNFTRSSPSRSRPSTPSLINKPAPIVPHYQMNLVATEYLAPESHLYEPSSPEVSRSPTPKCRSPAPGPPSNPLKAQAPRFKEITPQRHSLLTQATSNLRKEHEIAQSDFQSNTEPTVKNGGNRKEQDYPLIVKEHQQSAMAFKTDNYLKGDLSVKEDSAISQNYNQRQMESKKVSEFGNTTVQTTRKTFEEFERSQSAKVLEIRKDGVSYTGEHQIQPNIQSSNVNATQVFPSPFTSFPSPRMNASVSSSVNLANDNIATASRNIETCQIKPSISGANQGPVCDPTPSTGSSVGATARGKTFGVSSAPKRGRGILNKAALPGSRVPLCASCNGNISY